jgi:predicted dehydrogenase
MDYRLFALKGLTASVTLLRGKMMEYNKITLAELGIPEFMPMPKRKDWRIGIIGFGGIACGAHVPAYKEVGWSIVAVADPDQNALKEAKEKYGIKRLYPDYKSLVADDEVEIIDLCTQPIIREDVVLTCANAKKHVITEKPFATTMEECQRMVDSADRAGIKLAVHQNYRWMCMNYIAHHIVKLNLIGDPFFASIEIFGRQDVDLAKHPFYSRCDGFLTIQWDNHLADLLRYWVGIDAVRVFARTGRMVGQNFSSDNLLVVIADFGNGLTGHILHTELLRSSLSGVECRIDGSKGSITFDFNNNMIIDSSVLGKGLCKLDLSGSNFVSSHAGSMGDFLVAIEENKEPSVSGKRNLATIRTIIAEDKSARLGGRWIMCSDQSQ